MWLRGDSILILNEVAYLTITANEVREEDIEPWASFRRVSVFCVYVAEVIRD